jgi:hypothetical protein
MRYIWAVVARLSGANASADSEASADDIARV